MIIIKRTKKKNSRPSQGESPSKSLKRQPLSELAKDNLPEEPEYEVEKILKYCEIKDKYLVQWRGFRRKTYEPIENLYNCIDLVNETRRLQKLELIPHVSRGLCGATTTPGVKLNPNNWVPLEKIKAKIEQIFQERFPELELAVTLGQPQTLPGRDEIFLMCASNHCISLFYRRKNECGYIFDSENSWLTNNPLKRELARLEEMMPIKAVKYTYQARLDFCASQVASAAIELISWHRRDYIPEEIHPSPVIRRRLETFFHKETSEREAPVDLAKCGWSKKLPCHTCGKLISRRGNYQHFANCRGPI